MKKNNQKITSDVLAGMIKRGFDEMGENIGEVKREVKILSENNSREHEAIMLRLDNACPVR